LNVNNGHIKGKTIGTLGTVILYLIRRIHISIRTY
jgi:hypothetical protein